MRSDSATTSELLRELLRDPRVLSAEPNYIGCPAEEGSDDTAAEVVTDEASEVEDEEYSTEEPEDQTESVAEEVEVPATPATEDVAAPTNDDIVEPALTAQSDPSGPTSQDLTGYQWFSKGATSVISQYPGWTNPAIKAPNWNTPGTTNASGVVAIMDSGIDYTHPDLAGVMYHFSPELQAKLGCGAFGYAPDRNDKTNVMDREVHGTHVAGIVAAQ